MRDMAYWKCFEEGCKDQTIYRFKGLCRSCTTYELGEPKNAVNRQKVDEAGTQIAPVEKVPMRAVTLQDYKTFRRTQKRLTNKQHQALVQAHQHTHNEHNGRHAHTCDDDCDHEPIPEVLDIGESINEEE
mgnify:FL=1|tara:strand:- start:1285 stop:1674 length:390 start_codon:yes stop_codon:yes gene_type:complete